MFLLRMQLTPNTWERAGDSWVRCSSSVGRRPRCVGSTAGARQAAGAGSWCMGRLQGHPLPGQPRGRLKGHAVLLEELAGRQAECGEPGEVALGQGRWWGLFPCADMQAQKLACTLCTPTHTHLKPLPSHVELSNQRGVSACVGLAAGWQAVWGTEGKGSTCLRPALAGMTSKGPRHCSDPQPHMRCMQTARGTQAPGRTLSCQLPGWREVISKQPA